MVKSATETGDHIEKGWGDNAYAVSKVGITALTRIQQREINELLNVNLTFSDILINSCHPGDIKTEMSNFTGYFTPEEGRYTC